MLQNQHRHRFSLKETGGQLPFCVEWSQQQLVIKRMRHISKYLKMNRQNTEMWCLQKGKLEHLVLEPHPSAVSCEGRQLGGVTSSNFDFRVTCSDTRSWHQIWLAVSKSVVEHGVSCGFVVTLSRLADVQVGHLLMLCCCKDSAPALLAFWKLIAVKNGGIYQAEALSGAVEWPCEMSGQSQVPETTMQ